MHMLNYFTGRFARIHTHKKTWIMKVASLDKHSRGNWIVALNPRDKRKASFKMEVLMGQWKACNKDRLGADQLHGL